MANPADQGDPIEAGRARLLAEFKRHWPAVAPTQIEAACDLAMDAHSGQVRKSGEPYLIHPLEVARVVASLGMDSDTVVAAVLHDVLEDTDISRQAIERQFGADVLGMIEGVTKLKLNINPGATDRQRAVAETTRAAESLRKLLLAMARDIRVMLIKLADRLHNMNTLGSLDPARQARIANETLEVYAPIAARLGIWQLKWQLEDLSFKWLHPVEFQQISEMVAKTRHEREAELRDATEILGKRLIEKGVNGATVLGRPKHLFSIFNKHVKQGVPWDEILDLTGLRVIVQEEHECYLVLGLVYEMWKPIPGLFSDYIQTPKSNGYQSLHVKVVGPSNEPMEVQIRTIEMHEVAEFGVAAHWTYKEGSPANSASERFGQLRKQLFDWSSDNESSNDFLRSVSTDLFSEQVFAFTPMGDVVDLPAGSTPIDFAFRVHTRVGESLVGAKVNGQIVTLGTEIKNGDVIEIVTRSNAQPSLDWLEHAKSSHTRSKIRAYFRRRDRGKIIARGKELLERELRSYGLDPRSYLGDEVMKEIAKEVRDCTAPEDVFARVGENLSSVQFVSDKIRAMFVKTQPDETRPQVKARRAEPTLITAGLDNFMIKRARCCQPLPGEEVLGYVTRGRGIMIHRAVCPNAIRMNSTEPERITPIRWEPDATAYPVEVRIVTVNRQGLLMDITAIFGESHTNVVGAKIKTLPNNTAEIMIGIEVRSAAELRELMTKISNFSDVISILRLFGPGAKS